ncbi:unnamed protein product [Ectocarpus sp. CCAP 1310/34]|nr:unnamed protein product [Ectocarpus sp. CCAP 1310/34]
MVRLRDIISERLNAFRRDLRHGDPTANVKPLRVTLNPGARPVVTAAADAQPDKTSWLAGCMASLNTLDVAFPNILAVRASSAMTTLRKRENID